MNAKPTVDAEQLGAVIDAFATTNALMFMMLASDEKTDAALELLDLLSSPKDENNQYDVLRAHVGKATAYAMRQLQAVRDERVPLAGGARTSDNADQGIATGRGGGH